MTTDQWIPRRCSAEYLEARQQELDALNPEHYLRWNAEANLSEPVVPMPWAEDVIKAVAVGVTVAWGSYLAWLAYQAIGAAWKAVTA